jgi:multifunctional 2-oxoglutarate metabolism enzyme
VETFFGDVSTQKDNGKPVTEKNIPQITPGEDDEVQVIAGSAARILENMDTSLSIPVATSQRTMPVKLLEENRIIINQQLKIRNEKKISFTHLISWAIIKAVKEIPAMNNAFTVINGKPHIIKRQHINLGLAIDIEKKDGSRSLIVPNIKHTESKTFKEFVNAYEDIVSRTRKGTIDPSEFVGTTVTLTNPGTIGTVTSVPRLMVGQGAIFATGAIQYPAEYQAMSPQTISALGVSKSMNMTSTYDHRIIQGAESGLFLKEVHDLLTGEKDFYKDIFDDLQIPLQPLNGELITSLQYLPEDLILKKLKNRLEYCSL